MSISSMTNVARDRALGRMPPARGSTAAAEVAAAAHGQTSETDSVTAALDVIMAYVPTEILTLYVAVLAAIQTGSQATQPGEWTTFWVFLIATPVTVWLLFAGKVRGSGKGELLRQWKSFPLWEMFAATVAYCSWAFALPKSPFMSQEWYQSSLAGLVVLVTATLLGLLAPIARPPDGGAA